MKIAVTVRAGPAMVEVAARDVALRAGDRVAYATFDLREPGEYEAHFRAGAHVLAKVTFRIVS